MPIAFQKSYKKQGSSYCRWINGNYEREITGKALQIAFGTSTFFKTSNAMAYTLDKPNNSDRQY